LTDADANFSICPGMKEAELEDLYDPKIYEDVVKNTYRVTLQSPKFKTKNKWSERMREVFRQQGKRWNNQVETNLKGKISEVIASDPENALLPNKRASFDGLVSALEQRLNELAKSR